jgi:hypothetical protein
MVGQLTSLSIANETGKPALCAGPGHQAIVFLGITREDRYISQTISFRWNRVRPTQDLGPLEVFA